MTPNLVLFIIAVSVAVTCLLFWLRRLTVDFQHLQGNYIELHAMHSELAQRHQWLANQVSLLQAVAQKEADDD
jgi:hypothetical protein